MSKLQARAAMEQLVGRPAFVMDTYFATGSEVTSSRFAAHMERLANAVPAEERAMAAERRGVLAESYGFDPAQAHGKSFIFENGYAVIPVHGALLNKFSESWGFATGYNFIRDQMSAALADPEVKGIVFDVDSPGGSVAGCAETADMIAGSTKPTLACVDDTCASAAYYLSSQADRVVATPSSEVGSIGTVLRHVDVSKALEAEGVNVTLIHAGKHKVDGNPYEPLSKEVKADLQAKVDTAYDQFVAAVAVGRDSDEADVRATEARIYAAKDALDMGLIDAVQNPADAVEAFTVDAIDSPKEPTMSIKKPDPAATTQAEVTSAEAVAQAQTDARAAERTRIAAIQGHAEAYGRATLAAHLALQTDMTPEAAGAILAAAPKEAKAEAPKPTEQKAEGDSEFKKAMNADKTPGVGASQGTTEDKDNMTPAKRILAIQARYHGSTAKH